MLGNLNGWHLLIILAVILLLFGAAKLPALAKSVGQSTRIFKGEMKAMKEEEASASTSESVEASPTDATADSPASPSGTAESKP
jgi:sec-independent protein translocase protein TatA